MLTLLEFGLLVDSSKVFQYGDYMYVSLATIIVCLSPAIIFTFLNCQGNAARGADKALFQRYRGLSPLI